MKAKLQNYKRYLIVDLEATCCDKSTIARHEMEIIEIGAVMVQAETLQVESEFSTFIRPVRHPVLTKFCTELTHICQSDVDKALLFPEAVQVFKKWLFTFDGFVFCSWGDYDKGQMIQDCEYHRISYPMGADHVNVKKLFSDTQKLKKRYGMAGALKITGTQLQGTHHRGIDDARNIARLMPYILGRKMIRKSTGS